MFGNRLTLFELFGFKVRVDLSWALLALLIAWSLAQGYFPFLYEGLPQLVYWWMGIAGVVGLFFSIVIHEVSHSIVARLYGLPIEGITLFMFGGVAEMEQEPVSPKAEFVIAIAGPIASVVLALVFHGIAAAALALGAGPPAVAVAGYLAFLNLLLAVFNMVPAFPLDGGRVLRALLWRWYGSLRQATRTASTVGVMFGYLLAALGILSALGGNLVAGIWWFLIGLFIRAAASGSYHQLVANRILEGQPIRRFMTTDPVTVPSHLTIRELVDDYLHRHYFDLFPVVDGATLSGCVETRQIGSVPREQWDSVTVGSIASACSDANTVAADEDAVRVMSRMQRGGASRLMVVDRGRLVGVVALRDLMNLIRFRLEFEDGERSG